MSALALCLRFITAPLFFTLQIFLTKNPTSLLLPSLLNAVHVQGTTLERALKSSLILFLWFPSKIRFISHKKKHL